MGQGGGIAFSEEDKADDVHHRIDVRPVEVDVGDAPGRFLQVDEQSRDGIGNTALLAWRTRLSPSRQPWIRRDSVKSDVSPRSTSTK